MQTYSPFETRDEESLEHLLDTLAAEGRVRRLAQRDNADLSLWCRQRRRRASLRRLAAAVCILATISLSSATIMAQQLPDSCMRVPEAVQQKSVNDLATQRSETLCKTDGK